MMKTKCIKCRYWICRTDVAINGNAGECRRYPPIVCLKGMPVDKDGKLITSPLQGQAMGMIQVPQQYWPMTTADGYCGEFQPDALAIQ